MVLYIMDRLTIDPLFSLILQLFVGLLLLMTGLHKAIDRQRFSAAIEAYQLVPVSAVGVLAVLLSVTEIITGAILLLVPVQYWAVAMAALILFLYLLVIAISLVRGRVNIDCGCSLIRRGTLLSRWHLVRSAVMFGFVCVLFLPASERSLNTIDITQTVFAILALGLIYLSIDLLLSNLSYLNNEKV